MWLREQNYKQNFEEETASQLNRTLVEFYCATCAGRYSSDGMARIRDSIMEHLVNHNSRFNITSDEEFASSNATFEITQSKTPDSDVDESDLAEEYVPEKWFPTMSESEIKDLIHEKSHGKRTQQKTKWGVGIFQGRSCNFSGL